MFTLLPGEGLVGCPHLMPSVSCPEPLSEHSLAPTPIPLPPVLADKPLLLVWSALPRPFLKG